MNKIILALILAMFLVMGSGYVCAVQFHLNENSDIQDNPVFTSCFGVDEDQNYYLFVLQGCFDYDIPYFPGPYIPQH